MNRDEKRDEEIVAAAKKFENREYFSDIVHSKVSRGVDSACGVGFLEGAVWSDEHPRKGLVDIEKVKDFLSSVDLNFYQEREYKFNTDELIVDLEKYLLEEQ